MKMQVRNSLKPGCSNSGSDPVPSEYSNRKNKSPHLPHRQLVVIYFSLSSCVSYVRTMEAKSGNKTTEQNKICIFISARL